MHEKTTTTTPKEEVVKKWGTKCCCTHNKVVSSILHRLRLIFIHPELAGSAFFFAPCVCALARVSANKKKKEKNDTRRTQEERCKQLCPHSNSLITKIFAPPENRTKYNWIFFLYWRTFHVIFCPLFCAHSYAVRSAGWWRRTKK